MIKLILFDYGGVLGSDSNAWQQYFQEILRVTGLSFEEMDQIFTEMWPDLRVGNIDIDSFWVEVSKSAKKEISEHTLEEIHKEHITIDNDVLDLAKELKSKGFRIAILANESRTGINNKIEKFNLTDTFEKVYCSAMIGFSKPDIKAFQYVIEDLRVAPSEIIFIDNLEKNTIAARSLGMKTVLFKDVRRAREEVEKLLSSR